jgi:MFS family permease
MYCVNHPKVETLLRCNKCGNPICTKCARRTPVGFRCPQCFHAQQAVFYTATPLDYALAVVIGLVLSVLAAAIMRPLGWFFAIFLGPIAGGLIAEAIHRAISGRRGRWMAWVVVGCIVAGALLPLTTPAVATLLFSMTNPIAWVVSAPALLRYFNIVYIVLASITAYARLR